jgi:hydrogenase large subunit
MPSITVAIDPITRIEGHLRIDVEVGTVQGVQQIVDAKAVGTLFRGFETVLQGRDPRDATLITSRICGVCPTAHGLAASLALDEAFGVTPPETGRILRNLVHGACFLESHILHFYLLSLPDFVRGPGMAPWAPDWSVGRRLDPATAERLQAHYLAAFEIRRKAHEMGAIFGGKLPHTPAFIAGGFTAVAEGASGDVAAFQALLSELIEFIEGTYIPDVELLAALFDDYFSIGRGYGNLMSFGGFRLNASGSSKLFKAGRLVNGAGSVLPVDMGAISEHVAHSWYDDATTQLHPSVGETTPQHPKLNGYSWLKAPRYDASAYECGPLARMAVEGEYTNGVSVMDRHLARAHEAFKLAQAMQSWVAALATDTTGYTHADVPETGSGVGLTEAPRGALGHWLEIQDSKISHYQVITPTCWNVSPRDDAGARGTLEEALVGTPVANADEPVEALRVIHSIDPCLDCATHVSVAGKVRQVIPPAVTGGICRG